MSHAVFGGCESAQLCPTLCNPMDCSLLGSTVHGILQARIRVGISSSRGSFWPRDQTCVSCIGRQILSYWGTWEVLFRMYFYLKKKIHYLSEIEIELSDLYYIWRPYPCHPESQGTKGRSQQDTPHWPVGEEKLTTPWVVGEIQEKWWAQCWGTGRISVVKKSIKDFPGGPMTKTPRSQCRGPGFDPWLEN